jgi:hypothetical protein
VAPSRSRLDDASFLDAVAAPLHGVLCRSRSKSRSRSRSQLQG